MCKPNETYPPQIPFDHGVYKSIRKQTGTPYDLNAKGSSLLIKAVSRKDHSATKLHVTRKSKGNRHFVNWCSWALNLSSRLASSNQEEKAMYIGMI